MRLGLGFVTTVTVLSVVLLCITANPTSNKREYIGDTEVLQRFVSFLKEDQGFQNSIANIRANPIAGIDQQFMASRRRRRDAEDGSDVEDPVDNNNDNDPTTVDQAGSEGFFDRAAKFVMELLQRFMKWINTD